MPYLYIDKRQTPHIWRYQIWDSQGKRRTFTGTTSKRETQDVAQRRQLYENEIRDGVREAPQPKFEDHPFEEISNEWLEWGRVQGGKRGHPWNWMHYRKCKLYMSYWRDTLKLKRMTDLTNCLARVERALRVLHGAKKSGKTINSYASALSAFCNWAVLRKYLATNPVVGLQRFEQTPTFKRRALTSDEVQRLLAAAETHHYGRARRLGYEIALASGLRKNEIRSLRVKHLDVKRGGLILESRWTKNRSDGFQPLPRVLVQRLQESALDKAPEDDLVFVGMQPGRGLLRDLKRAKIEPKTEEGKVDFHALRVAYITFVVESGADIKSAQTLARHSTPALTLNIYARARQERLAEITESVGNLLAPQTPGSIGTSTTKNKAG